MSRPPRAGTYRDLLRLPGAARAFVPATLGRLSYGTVSLSMLLTVRQGGGSFTRAGLVLAAFALPALILPVKSRLIDRRGQRPVLLVLGVGYPAALALLAVAAGRTPGLVVIALALGAGALTPPLGPAMRAVWAGLTDNRAPAYALDAVVEETLYVLGPLAVGAALTVVDARTALLATAGLAGLGTLGLATSPVVPGGRPAGAHGRSPVGRPEFRRVLIAVAAIGLSLGPVEIAVVARSPAAGPYLLALLSMGSIAGGLIAGRLSRSLAALLWTLSVGLALCALATPVVLLAVALALTGTALAPAFVVAYLAADEVAGESSRTEATTWVNTAYNIGTTAGIGVAGVVVQDVGPGAALLGGAVVVGLAALTA